MSKVTQLKKEALESCKTREHTMKRFESYCEDIWFAECKSCGMGVWVDPTPRPNDTEISGEAVALNCPLGESNF